MMRKRGVRAKRSESAQLRKSISSQKSYVSAIDVARLAGVSQSAVSRTFTKGASVSEKTRKKVVKAAEELGYQPSVIPRIMLTRRSLLVGVVIGGMDNPYYAGVIDLFAKEIQKGGSSVLLFSVKHGESIDEIIPSVSGYRVDGIVSALSMLSPRAAELFAKMQVPVVMLNGKVRNDWVSSVCCDNKAGGRLVAELFLARGVKRYAFISGRPEDLASEDRFSGYLERLAERGIRDVAVAEGQYLYEGGFHACCELLEKAERPQAIFCANDLMAIGAMEAAQSKYKLRIPEDMLIAGFDDIPAAGWWNIQLTTIRQNPARMVSEALSLLQRRVEGDAAVAGALRTVPVSLIERKTTGLPPYKNDAPREKASSASGIQRKR